MVIKRVLVLLQQRCGPVPQADDRRTDARTDVRTGARTDAHTDAWMDARTHGCMGARMDAHTRGHADAARTLARLLTLLRLCTRLRTPARARAHARAHAGERELHVRRRHRGNRSDRPLLWAGQHPGSVASVHIGLALSALDLVHTCRGLDSTSALDSDTPHSACMCTQTVGRLPQEVWSTHVFPSPTQMWTEPRAAVVGSSD